MLQRRSLPALTRSSCHRWEANQFRLFLHMGAYWLLHELRGAAAKRSIWRTATFETIRCTFLKIAVRIQELKTRIKMALPSSQVTEFLGVRHA
jgi:hypothetical protein